MLANKAFSFTPDYVLWGCSYQMINSMIMESYYLNKSNEVLKDEKGEYTWIELPTLDGVKRVKKYKENIV